MKKTASWYLKNTILYGVMVILILACLLPFIHVVALSFSSNRAVTSREVFLWPVEWNLSAYRQVMGDASMVRSLWFTILLTVLYTVICMAMTIMAAYPLSKSRLKGRRLFMGLIIFTMYFSGGMIPDYLLVSGLGLVNSIWALILPGAVNAFNLIILRTYFMNSVPGELEESASLDGLNDIGILIRIVLPLSLPIIATLSLFYAVNRWNGFQDAVFYINDQAKYPLPLKIYNIIFNNSRPELLMTSGADATPVPGDGLKGASIVFSTLPILVLYPWLQKYFVSGVMVGAVKA